MDSQITLKEIHAFARRRFKVFFWLFSLILIASILIAFLLPPVYQSKAMILIEEQQIPQDYVKSTITTFAEERLQMTTRQIMKYDQLKQIILDFGLYPDLVQNGDVNGAVEQMRESIELETINSKEGSKVSTVAFTLSYDGEEPATVQKVMESLVNLYLQEETKARGKLASITTDFLKEELENLKQQVNVHEKRISEFKSSHIGELPDNMALNLQNMASLERELENVNSRIRNLEDRKVYLKGQLAIIEPLKPVRTEEGQLASNPRERLKGLRLDLIRMQARLSELHPDIRKLKSEIAKLEAQVGDTDEAVEKIKMLSEKKSNLAELQSRLGSKHPDVIKLTKEIGILSKDVDKLVTETSIINISEERPDNPAYINIMTQVVSADTEIRGLEENKLEIKNAIEELQVKIQNTPLVEKDFKELTADYDNAKTKYNEILNKLMTAQVAQQMEEQQKGEKFTILEHPNLPSKPYKPNRIAIILLGLILACGASFAFAAIQEGMDHSFKTEDQVARLTGLPVLSSLSLVETREERRFKIMRKIIIAFVIAGVIAITLLTINNIVMPLEELITLIFSRIQL